jgi:hypothetical protein
MELKVWIWLIIIAGSFIANVIKKKRQSAPSPARRKPTSNGDIEAAQLPSENSPMTFEELLREIEGAKKSPAHRDPLPDEKYYGYSETSEQKPALLEDANYDYRQHDSIYDIYENAKKEAFSRPSLEETMKLRDTSVKYGAFRNYQRQRSSAFALDFAEEIRKPSGFKKAFIMSEIIQRRF